MGQIMNLHEYQAKQLFARYGGDDKKELVLVLKADVRGTAEAIKEGLEKLSTDKVKLRVIRSGVGAVSESDVMLAAAVRPEASLSPGARKRSGRRQQRCSVRGS